MTYPAHLSRPSASIDRPLLSRQDGAALVTVMFLAAVVLTLIVMGSRQTQIELRIAHNELLRERALNVAEAGLNHAFSLIQRSATGLNDDLGHGGTDGALTSLGNPATLSGVMYRFAAFGGGPGDGYYVKVADNYDEKTGADDPTQDQDNVITIISRGRVGDAERVVAATMKGQSVFPSIIFGKRFVSMSSSGTFTDSYNSSVAAYSKATASKNGSLFSNGDIYLNNAKVVVNGDTTAAGTVDTSGGTVTGTITEGAPPLSFPPVPICGPPYSDGSGIVGAKGDFSYDPATGVLHIKGSPTILAGTYCFSSITQASGGLLTVIGPTSVYVTGSVDISGGGISNNTGIPGNFLLLSSFVSAGNGVTVSGGSDAYMAIYAPDCGIKLSGGTDLYGSLIGASFSMTGNTGMHYDEALVNILLGNCTLSKWHEVRNS
jgi:hypothetical protein